MKSDENNNNTYNESHIRSLDWKEHIRLRPGMYIGKLGNGDAPDDGIYILVKEILDNAIDEFVMGAGKEINIRLSENQITIRDYGRGIPLGKVVEVVSKMNTGGKYDSIAFKKSVGLNGVGTKAVNALATHFQVRSIRNGNEVIAVFSKGELQKVTNPQKTNENNGVEVSFIPDKSIFHNYTFRAEFLIEMIQQYSYLNPGLLLIFNGEKYQSKNGLKDLLESCLPEKERIYPILHLKGLDIEVALTHSTATYTEQYQSFVNGGHTSQGGTHQQAFKESLVKTLQAFYNKPYEANDIRKSIVSAISIKVMDPVFESQTKTKLGSTHMGANLPSIRKYFSDFVKQSLDDYLHKHPDTAEAIQNKILQNQRERKDLAGIRKLARERAKKVSLHNKKLRDCKIHLNDTKKQRRLETTLFITEGDSASGSITQSRDVITQAVFSLKGKPLNPYGMSKKVVYENEEFNLLQAALNIEESIETLRYHKIVLATDADVDGMHIRLLLITFFLQFFPELIRARHLYILETPLFRVRNKKQTFYCYNESEKSTALRKLKGNLEITRFKGLGEISPDEFSHFIGKEMRLEPVILDKNTTTEELLQFYMGKNTLKRQEFIIENLKVEMDLVKTE